MIVHLTEQGAQARLRNGRLQIWKDDQRLADVPLHPVRLVVVWGNIGLTTPLLATLADRGIEVIFLTRRGRFRARLQGALTPHVQLRQMQYAARQQRRWRLQVSLGVVGAKLQHQRTLLQRQRRRATQPIPKVEEALQVLARSLAALPRKQSPHAVRGLEGVAARAYFRAWRDLLPSTCAFQGRRRRPPPDPVNALLSLGYTLLVQRVQSAVQAVGLDPYAGFLHHDVYGRPALALDLAEEFRPVVDGVVLRLCRQGLVTPESFEPQPDGGLHLKDEGLARFLQAFETRLARAYRAPGREQRRPLAQWMVEQAYQLARRLRNGEPGFQGLGFR